MSTYRYIFIYSVSQHNELISDVSKAIQFNSRQDPTLNGASVVPNSEVCKAAMLLLLMTTPQKKSNGMAFIPSFMKNGQ